jgi:hypothetical protein
MNYNPNMAQQMPGVMPATGVMAPAVVEPQGIAPVMETPVAMIPQPYRGGMPAVNMPMPGAMPMQSNMATGRPR